jgi:hypothetical protein
MQMTGPSTEHTDDCHEAAAPSPTAPPIMIKPTEVEWFIDSGASHHMTPL